MGKIDPKITEALKNWLLNDHDSDEMIAKGAEILLRVNRNVGLYKRILRNPKRGLSKLEYEIGKHVKIREQGFSVDDIVKMEDEIMPEISAAAFVQLPDDGNSLPLAGDNVGQSSIIKGKRPDHDKLPADIQAIWPENAERWKKIKATFEMCKSLEQPCDRFEHVKMLKEAWYKYKERMAQYDDFVLNTGEDGEKEEGEKSVSDEDKAAISTAQSYISRNLPVLQELVDKKFNDELSEEEDQKLLDLRSKVLERVNVLKTHEVQITDQRKADLLKVGIALEDKIDNSESDGQGEGSE